MPPNTEAIIEPEDGEVEVEVEADLEPSSTLVRNRSMKPFAKRHRTLGSFDKRHPLYLGDWKKSVPNVHDDIAVDDLDEPHMKRKLTILRDHPEIKQLYGYDRSTALIAIFATAIQMVLAYCFGRLWTNQNVAMVACAYFIGATITSLYGVIIHEATHCLAAPSLWQNRIIGFIANIGLPFPIFASFRRYHLEHHNYQGVVGADPDLPLYWEKRLIRGNSFAKLVWVVLYPIMYVLRGAWTGKSPLLSDLEIYNWIFTISTDTAIVYYCGWRGFFYLFLSLWFGYSLHPGAAHFIQEHYTFEDGQETYSYYGILNKILLNIGYHNEHHDFLRVPWSKLPKVRALAPEYYDNLAYHTSWLAVHWRFIWEPTYGPQSRVGRKREDHDKGRSVISNLRRALQEGS